jgi:hypothetical protein
MRVAGAEPIVARGLEGQRSYRLHRASGRSACHESDLGQHEEDRSDQFKEAAVVQLPLKGR